MLHHLTWTQFFYVAGICLLLYYFTVLLLFYRNELKALLEKTTNRLLPQVFLTSTMPESTPPTIPTDSPIGAVSTQDAPSLSDASGLQVAPRTEGEEEEEDIEETDSTISSAKSTSTTEPHTFPMGTLADFLQEIKSLLELVAETQMEKEEFISLLQLIITKYSRTAQSQYQDQVQRFLLEQSQDRLPFELAPEDLQPLWTKA